MALLLAAASSGPARAQYVNFESSHVHPIALTPSGSRLLAVNTPDARLEVFTVTPAGDLVHLGAIPVGMEPVTVVPRTEQEAWVVNNLSDSISIVDLALATTVRTLRVGDEPTDVAFARGRAYVTVAQEDAVKVFDLSNLDAAPLVLPIFGSDPRALAVSPDGGRVYAVALNSGNRTTVVNAGIIADNSSGLDAARLAALGLNNTTCNGAPPPYPPLPPGITRNPALTDPAPPAQPPVGLIVRWNDAAQRWEDEAGQDWTHCLPFRLPDHDLFVIDANSPAPPSFVDHLGTTLFEVSVNPVTGRVYVPHTEARNTVRFEHELGVRGHVVDNRIAMVDPAAGNQVTILDLNAHLGNRTSDPDNNLAERQTSISQPGMMVWNAAGTRAYLTAIGSRKLFRIDAGCLGSGCVFGPNRSQPDAVEVGEGPTGVALLESRDRLYVLNRFTNSIAVVAASSLTKLGEVPLHDPGPAVVRDGRRLLYDGITSSRHGDAACSSCHISGNMDKLAWDLGDPEGSQAVYGTPGDNVRFIIPLANQPVECSPAVCAAHDGFDPQKGPMTTQTLRAMLEPLHWRGDRGTMNDFNPAFVGLMGMPDLGPVNGKPAGHDAPTMELFRQFSLGIRMPPNPFRNVDDTLPNAQVSVPGQPLTGNPTTGSALFSTGNTDGGSSCSACHALPFGTAGGKLGGINPGDPPPARAALFNGMADGSPHSDLKVPHMRNMYEKFGPRFASFTNPLDPPAANQQKSGFGFTHDGSVPDLLTFFSASVFTLTAQQVRDVAVFNLFFPTGTRPAVGQQVSVPAGPAPTGSPAQETLLSTLVQLGNASDTNRHCELTASARSNGRPRTWYLNGGIGAGGLWTTDVDGEAQIGTAALRQGADGPLTFVCTTLGSGVRLGADLDLDGHRNASDCSDGHAGFFAPPAAVTNLLVTAGATTHLGWDPQPATSGPGVYFEVAGGSLSGLGGGLAAATGCVSGALQATQYDDARPLPPPGDGHYYLVRARSAECSGGFGASSQAIESLDCSAN